jgi:hypothetical protein
MLHTPVTEPGLYFRNGRFDFFSHFFILPHIISLLAKGSCVQKRSNKLSLSTLHPAPILTQFAFFRLDHLFRSVNRCFWLKLYPGKPEKLMAGNGR